MKTISYYRQAAVSKKPKNLYLIALVVAASFISGILVGSSTQLLQDAAAAGGAAVRPVFEYISSFYSEVVYREVLSLVEFVRNSIVTNLSGLEPEFQYLIGA